jgi:hypothetical protein
MPETWDPDAPVSAVELNYMDQRHLRQVLYLVRRGYLGNNEMLMPFYAYHEDSLDSTHSTTFKFWIPKGTGKVVELGLRLSLLPYRAYSTAAAAGGGTTATSGASSANTTDGGGGTTATSGASSANTTDGGGGTTATSGASSAATTAAGGGTTATSGASSATTTASGGQTTSSGGGNHSHSMTVTYTGEVTTTESGHNHGYVKTTVDSNLGYSGTHTHDIGSHTHDMPHTHDVTLANHTHGMAHTHDVTLANHTHGMAHTHDVTLTNHTHGATYGIYEGATATGVTVTVNGTDRTAALGGGAGFTTDQDWLDIKAYAQLGTAESDGLNTIILTSTGLGRIRAQVDGTILRAFRQ